MPDDLPAASQIDAVELRRRQRGRNLTLLVVLLATAALFYAISMVKFRVS